MIFNQGYLTVDGGVKLIVFDLNMAIFTQELCVHLGDRPSAGSGMCRTPRRGHGSSVAHATTR